VFDLKYKNIIGVFDGNDYDLLNITELNLSYNKITEIKNIPNSVTELNLSYNKITETINVPDSVKIFIF
jgi:Leucine-rich repeat (LRR) protein